ncbi:hypothetical protein B0H14DRAFT_3523509 [Mycena olivaceomarginata]|nr:hypothetical protein B0H14DRAFT_3523509 [Mycena olivaceomarginata]
MADDPTSDAPSVETPAGAAGPATNPNAAPQGQTSNAPSSDAPNAEGALPLPDDSNGEATLSYTPGAPSAPPNAPDMPNAPTVPADTRSAPSDALLPLGSIVSESGEVYTPPPRPAVVKRVREKKPRRKSGDPPGKPGKVSWAWGTKLEFFDKRKTAWVTAHKGKTAGDFYTKLTKLYLVKYGYHLADEEDFEVDVADPPDWVANKVVNEVLTEEESTFRQEYYGRFRDRLGQWYRREYASLLEEDKTTFTDIFGQLGEGTRKPPRRPQLMHFYSEKRYDSHIRPRVEERKRALEQRAEFTGEKVPVAIKIQNVVTKECWDEESLAYQEEMVRERERQHERHVKAWRDSNADGPNRTPEEFSASLKSAAHYLQPFVDIIADRYGMCVSILMVGPIGEHGGRIEMRSVHSGKTRGLVEKDWPLHDPEGFTRVQESMVDFGHHVFSQAERDARITAVQEPDTADGMSVSSGAAPTAAVRNASPNGAGFSSAAALGAGAAASGPAGAPNRIAAAADGASGGSGGTPEENGGGGGDGPADEEDGGGDGPAEEEDGDGVQHHINKLWQRRDAGKWTEEFKKAHAALERGKVWGIEWASLTGGRKQWNIGSRERGNGRKTVDIGVLGDAKKPGSFVASWWDWWVNVQPSDRSDLASVLRLHGKNGLLQMMASLLWWGERVADGTPADVRDWSSAVEDVADLLKEMLRPGVIARFKKSESKGDAGPRGNKRKTADTTSNDKGKERARRGQNKDGEDGEENGARTKRARRSSRWA